MKKFIILIPIYNDWKSFFKLLENIDLEIISWQAEVSIMLINDASTDQKQELKFKFKNIKAARVINMKENRGHARCIAAGLKYIYKNENFDQVIVMDGDGEDRPEELNHFYKKSLENPNMTITGNRHKRAEGMVFKILYEVHKALTFVFTGKLIKFGNFSCLPKEHVKKLVEKPYLWNSYSSSVVKIIKDRTSIPSIRGARYVLPSKMSFISLIFHSLTIISVFRNLVIIRSIIFLLVYLFLISNNIFTATLIPILFLLVFVFYILKISMRTNMEEFNKSLDNIVSVDILNNSNSR